MRNIVRFALKFVHDAGGGIIPLAAAGVPVVALLAIAATELASLSAEKRRMQDTADAVVLDAANQLSFSSPESVLARAKASAGEQLASMQPRTTLSIDAELIEDGKGVRLLVNGNRLSFFGNMLPPGGFKTHVHSSAMTMNTAPLCVVSLEADRTLKLDHTAQVDAGECLVHSNGKLEVNSGAQLRAYAIQTVGSAQGVMTPAALTGAAEIADPFASENLRRNSPCSGPSNQVITEAETLRAGRHCGTVEIDGVTATLSRGVHTFDGPVSLKNGAVLRGDDVAVVFQEGAAFVFDDTNVRISLTGQQSGGRHSGFVFLAGANRVSDIELSARHLEKLEGVVYSRNARLRIGQFGSGASDDEDDDEDEGVPVVSMAALSKWTVVVAKEIEVRDNAAMTVNSSYASSNVPVPPGVGDKIERNVRLLR